jgi:L-2-amino-thiazoline-4-carboxylic acid hydrolase
METKNLNFNQSRRKFLTRHLPAGAMVCLGCKSLLSAPSGLMNPQEAVQKAKYLMNSGMSTEEVFKFTYNYFVPILKNMGKKMGNDKLLEMLKAASAENMVETINAFTKGVPGDMKAFTEFVRGWLSTPPYDRALTYEVTEESDKVFEAKYKECLVAKIYREMNAADIGYAIECAGSDKIAKAFNPKMEAKSIKNLMKGDDVCIERFTLKA